MPAKNIVIAPVSTPQRPPRMLAHQRAGVLGVARQRGTQGRAARVAGAFSAQIVDAVPSAPHDITMDTVVTEAGVVVDRPRGW